MEFRAPAHSVTCAMSFARGPDHAVHAYAPQRARPDFHWPGGRRVAAYILLHIEHTEIAPPAAEQASTKSLWSGQLGWAGCGNVARTSPGSPGSITQAGPLLELEPPEAAAPPVPPPPPSMSSTVESHAEAESASVDQRMRRSESMVQQIPTSLPDPRGSAEHHRLALADDGHIGHDRGSPGPVDHQAASNKQIEHACYISVGAG